ncbi:hypothetical protein BVRB_9g225890 [Beta vulgaris subsp. vulgaris]|uniref:Uncharacterized protein n=1 Tax=Beta vulgaris subsp. vulgaris TaxID=3555 RepID=A0A0J8B932_BETVV|nr:hypothetical protein BVRB_9g225890 [Beta vulgaris subsp. vulgaris]
MRNQCQDKEDLEELSLVVSVEIGVGSCSFGARNLYFVEKQATAEPPRRVFSQ